MTTDAFSQRFSVRWADLDANAHMKNTAYMEYAIQVRFAYFNHHGFSAQEFAKRQFGPVIFREEIAYFKEVHMLEEIDVTMLLGAINADASRFALVNQIFKADGQKAASVRTEGAWFDRKTRKLIAPPQELAAILLNLKRTDDFQAIEK